jgi:hypothetical protein
MRLVTISLCLLGLVACSANAPKITINNTVASKSEQTTANMVKSYAMSSAPPSGATSMGMQAQPQAGGKALPIANVEVFVFQANVDSDPSPETMYWATDGTATYVWGATDLVCVDDNDQPTGESGTADFIMEVDSGGYGWMVSTTSCGYTTLFGCSNDGSGDVCGGCDYNQDFIACVASST